MEKFLKKKTVVFVILLIVLVGAFWIRTYHHHDWLYFKMDQARDAFTVSKAVLQGPGELPLLGPRAGATDLDHGFLNLGPIFYYFQYASGVIFHSIDPAVFAYPDLFFSLAVLPLLYIFARLYFKRHISLGIVVLYAFSYLIIQYSRFAWNPNSLPFFTLLSFFSLIKFFHPQREKHKKWWIILWALGLAVGSQLHFVGFFSLAGVSALMFFCHARLWNPKKIKGMFQKEILKKIGLYAKLAILVFLIFYAPVIISDSKRGWENSRNFVEALSSKPSDNTLREKVIKNISEETRYYTLITTAYLYRPDKIKPKESLPVLFTIFIFFGGMYLALRKIRRFEDKKKRDFLIMILLWFFVYFILCIPLAYSIRPRFFIFTFALPFIFAGLIAEHLENSNHKYKKAATVILGALILLGNVWGTCLWFQEQSLSQKKHLEVERTLILKVRDGVTLGQLEKAADFIISQTPGGEHIYYYVKPEHIRPVDYILFEKNPYLIVENKLDVNADPKANYFVIVPSDYKRKDVLEKTDRDYTLLAEEKVGQIKVLKIDFPGRIVSSDFQADSDLKSRAASLGVTDEGKAGKSNRVFWKDVF